MYHGWRLGVGTATTDARPAPPRARIPIRIPIPIPIRIPMAIPIRIPILIPIRIPIRIPIPALYTRKNRPIIP